MTNLHPSLSPFKSILVSCYLRISGYRVRVFEGEEWFMSVDVETLYRVEKKGGGGTDGRREWT